MSCHPYLDHSSREAAQKLGLCAATALCNSRVFAVEQEYLLHFQSQGAFEKFLHEKRDGFSTMNIPTLVQFPPFEKAFLRFSHTQEGIVPRGNVVHPPCE